MQRQEYAHVTQCLAVSMTDSPFYSRRQRDVYQYQNYAIAHQSRRLPPPLVRDLIYTAITGLPIVLVSSQTFARQ